MTSDRQGVGDLDAILARTRYLLLDFDGPICDVYAGLPAATVADLLRKHLDGRGIELPDEVVRTADPIEVFAFSATISADLAAEVEAEMTDLEITAVTTAKPTPYVHEVFAACCETGRTAAIVSNNSARAVNTYLAQHGLDDRISHVIARTSHDPALLKPNPYLVEQALAVLGAEPSECTLLGDSVTDIESANVANVASIGYANRLGKQEQFTGAEAGAIVATLANLVLRLRAQGALDM